MSALHSLGAPPAPSALGQTTTSGSLASELLSRPQDPVATWWADTATSDDLQVASGQSSLSADVIVPRSGRLGKFPALAVLGSGVDVFSILEPALTQLEGRLPGVQIRIPLDQGARVVRLANGGAVSFIRKTVPLQSTIDTPCGPVILDSERYA